MDLVLVELGPASDLRSTAACLAVGLQWCEVEHPAPFEQCREGENDFAREKRFVWTEIWTSLAMTFQWTCRRPFCLPWQMIWCRLEWIWRGFPSFGAADLEPQMKAEEAEAVASLTLAIAS